MLRNYKKLLTFYSFHILLGSAACRSISISYAAYAANVDQGLINDHSTHWGARSNQTSSLLHSRQSASPQWLRIMPLGASIVRGVRSDPEDGFRKPLRDNLRQKGHQVNMVGSQQELSAVTSWRDN
jgi:hypothetical protein